MDRRPLLLCPLLALSGLSPPLRAAPPVTADRDADALSLLARGGVVLALRHALAPGTYDPPQFRLGDCSTQRNLNDAGRAQARALGDRLRSAGLTPARVRSSPWCRCMETAELAFGRADPWPALGSPRAGTDTTNAGSLAALRQAVAAAARHPGRFDAWVTHMFVLSALVRADTSSGEGLVLGQDRQGDTVVLARLGAA